MNIFLIDTNLKSRRFARFGMIPAILALLALFASQSALSGEDSSPFEERAIVVYKTPNCGCCTKWVGHLRDNDFRVTVINVQRTHSIQNLMAVPGELRSCHTAVTGGYFVEGHVPADVILQLLEEQPENIIGLTVPGMPPGSPGMESPHPVEYQILSVDQQGKHSVYASKKGMKLR